MEKQAGTTKANGQKHSLDKFYTKSDVAKTCIDSVDPELFEQIIEPSAGSGSFSKQIRGCVAFDLDPEDSSVVEQDWFAYEQLREAGSKVLVIGNPPFGQQNSLAVKFINHAAGFADTIAFILPRSFMKESVQKLLYPNLHLRSNVVLERNSFTLEEEDMDVPCVFQIWDYNSSKVREHVAAPGYVGFSFVKKAANPDLYVQRVGGKAGSAGVNFLDRSEQSNYFLKVDPSVTSAEALAKIINGIDFKARNLSVGPRSLSKKEFLVDLLLAAPALAASAAQ